MRSPSIDLRTEIPGSFSFSQSSLADYADCARRFQLRYLEQLSWPAVETEPVAESERREQVGLLFHRLVHQHLLGLPADKLAPRAKGPDLERWWKNYLRTDFKLSGYAKHTEFSLSAPLGGFRLLARYDLLAIKEDRAVIFDWKTSRKRPSDDWMAERWQTRVYPAVLARAGAQLNHGRAFQPEEIEIIYWFADFPSEPARIRYSAERLERDWSALEQAAQRISAAREFPLTDDLRQCSSCVYRSYCNRGAQAGELAETTGEPESDRIREANVDPPLPGEP